MSPAAGAVRVRMYNVGFGDAFLVLVRTHDGERRLLFDCGTIGSAPGSSIEKVAQRIVADVTDPDGTPRIDVVVATHRHADHVSGFAKEVWADVAVKEVWMPWTEHPTDSKAREIRDAQTRLAARLAARFQSRLAVAGLDAAETSRLTTLHETALNALSNESAMDRLHNGFVGDPLRRFLPDKDAPSRSFRTPVLPGVTIHVLGPSRDPDVIAKMDPPRGQHYLRLSDELDAEGRAPEPFHSRWWVPPDQFPPPPPPGSPSATLTLADDDRAFVRSTGDAGGDELLAASLEDAVNGTSLMLMLQVGRAHLLFPGDAQWGTWEAALADDECRELMKRTVFYKIGHHGSHNATPVEFVEEVLGEDFWAMASTRKRGSWPVPKPELMAALAAKPHARVARSDQAGAAAAFSTAHPLALEVDIPT